MSRRLPLVLATALLAIHGALAQDKASKAPKFVKQVPAGFVVIGLGIVGLPIVSPSSNERRPATSSLVPLES